MLLLQAALVQSTLALVLDRICVDLCALLWLQAASLVQSVLALVLDSDPC